jgi:hypothetical protein
MSSCMDNRPAPQPERVVITEAHTADYTCARTPIQLETPPGYFGSVMRGLQTQADEGRLTREDLAKIEQEAIVERARRSEPGYRENF